VYITCDIIIQYQLSEGILLLFVVLYSCIGAVSVWNCWRHSHVCTDGSRP